MATCDFREPWSVDHRHSLDGYDYSVTVDADGHIVDVSKQVVRERVVASMNAMAGVADPDRAAHAVRYALAQFNYGASPTEMVELLEMIGEAWK